jgi:HAD superfamily hydrolase (TIGR01509 family)
MPDVSGVEHDSPEGEAIGKRRSQIFKEQFLPHLQPFRDSARLVAVLKARGCTIVAASSAKRQELQPLLAVAGAEALMDASTSGDDADESKPDPDIIQAALTRANVSPEQAVMVGDTPYDVEAARRAGVAVIAFRCGGWGDADLKGAVAIYDGPWDLLSRLDESPLRSVQKSRNSL